MRYKITLQYDGSGYHGWQKQPNATTVQAAVEKAISQITQTVVRLHASGRTDEGVHALGQVAHFDTQKTLEPERWVAAINYWLPEDIRVVRCQAADKDFHARKSALKKTYHYRMYTAPVPNPLRRLREVWVKSLDVAKMDSAAKVLIGRHDFASFVSAGSDAKSTVREIFAADVVREGGSVILKITGSGFLYNMVRIIADVLMKIGRSEIAPERLGEILESRKRSSALGLAPPYGLYLYSVEY